MREIIRRASGESLDLKACEADMRHLIDTYIEADEPRTISPFEDMTLLELIVKTGIAQAITSQLGGLRGNKHAIAETIENNVRRKIKPDGADHPAQHGTRQEAPGVPRVCRPPRDGPPAGAHAQCAIPRGDGSLHADLARHTGHAQSPSGEA